MATKSVPPTASVPADFFPVRQLVLHLPILSDVVVEEKEKNSLMHRNLAVIDFKHFKASII